MAPMLATTTYNNLIDHLYWTIPVLQWYLAQGVVEYVTRAKSSNQRSLFLALIENIRFWTLWSWSEA